MSDTRGKAWTKRRCKQENAARMRERKRRQDNPRPSPLSAANEQPLSSGATLSPGDGADLSLESQSSPRAASEQPLSSRATMPPGDGADLSLESQSSPRAASEQPLSSVATLSPGDGADLSLESQSSLRAASEQPLSSVATLSPGDGADLVVDSQSVLSASPGPSVLSLSSPQTLAWRRKRSSKAKTQYMRECKEPPHDDEEPVRDPDLTDHSEEAEESSEEEFDAQEALDEWMLTLHLEQRRMLAVTLMEF